MKIFITGSTDGLGKLSAIDLMQNGYEVVLHARNDSRKEDILDELPQSEVFVADLSDMEQTKQLALDLNNWGKFDAVIHNAGVYRTSKEVISTVNVLAPYILTSLMDRPNRLIYVSSGLHTGGRASIDRLAAGINYSDSKLLLVMLTMTVARKWKNVYANAINPGWVPTKMGGAGAPDDLQKGYETQVWLATSNESDVKVSGKYFFHQKDVKYNVLADDSTLQDKLIVTCEQITGVQFPDG